MNYRSTAKMGVRSLRLRPRPAARALIVCTTVGLVMSAPLSAQTIVGTVRDGASKAPIPSVLITVLDSVDRPVRILTGDRTGHFALTMSPGTYAIDVRHPGYQQATTTAAPLKAGDTVAVTLDLVAVPVTLDTVVTKDTTKRGFFSVTPGREFVARHYALGKGIIVSGWEIEHSGKLLSEYLGTLPGIILTGSIPHPVNNPFRGWSPPAIPAANGQYLVSAYGQQCLYARIDRYSFFGMMMQWNAGQATDIDKLLKLSDVMAVEVYRDIREVPPEWQTGAWVRRIIWIAQPSWNYLLGDTGFPSLPLDSLTMMPGPAGGRIGQPLGALTMPRIIPNPMSILSLAQPWALDPESFSGGVPACGFMQIWTKIAW